MKQLLFLIFALLFLVDGFSQFRTNYFPVIKNPKEIIRANKINKEVVYSYIFNKKGVKDSVLDNTYYYDTLGYLIEERSAGINIFVKGNSSGVSIKKYQNTYNSFGELLRQIIDDQNLKMVTIYEFDYDSLGNEVNKYDFDKDTTRLTIEQRSYNEKNQVVLLQTKINNSASYISRKYYYNAEDELSKTEAFNNKGKVIYQYIYEYDKTLNKKTEYLENADGRNKTDEYFYNDDKQCIKQNSTFKSTTFVSRDYTESSNFNQVTENIYDKDKRVFESNVYLDGKKVQMCRHFYFME